MDWIRLSQGVPVYSGRLRRPASYLAWTRRDGAERVAQAAARERFSLLGRSRAARNALWLQLQHAAEKGMLAEAIRDSVRHFVKAAGEIAASPVGLPRAFVEGHRVVVVPRVTCITRAFSAMALELDHHPEIAALAGGTALRDFFYEEMVTAIDAALIQAGSVMRRPMPTGEGWYVVGFEPTMSWLVPVMGGPERRGQFYVYEAPSRVPKKWPFASLQARLRELHASTAALSRIARGEILRNAREVTEPRPLPAPPELTAAAS